jgi:hypothetical protein
MDELCRVSKYTLCSVKSYLLIIALNRSDLFKNTTLSTGVEAMSNGFDTLPEQENDVDVVPRRRLVAVCEDICINHCLNATVIGTNRY